jgi:hypothetical protein
MTCKPNRAANLTWCATGTTYRNDKDGTFSHDLGYHINAAGSLVYVILTRRDYPLTRDGIEGAVRALSTRYGGTPERLALQSTTSEGADVSSLIVYWGSIKLVRLSEAEYRTAAQGGAIGAGPLIDHRQDIRLSAQQRDPVYKVAGSAGFIAQFRSVTDLRTDVVLRLIHPPAFTGTGAVAPYASLPLDPPLARAAERIRLIEEVRQAALRREREEAERKSAAEREAREEAERKAAAERRREAERLAREEAERKAAEETRVMEERARRAEAEYQAALVRARRAEAERKAAEARAAKAEDERRAAEERAKRLEAERAAGEAKRQGEEARLGEERARREAAERKAEAERALRAEAERKAAAEKREIEERRAAEERARREREEAERRAAEEKRKEEALRVAEEARRAAEDQARRSAEEAARSAAAAPGSGVASRMEDQAGKRDRPPKFAIPPDQGGPAETAMNREDWVRMATALARNSPISWTFGRTRDRVSDDLLLLARAVFPAGNRIALEIAFECNVSAGQRLRAHARAFDLNTKETVPFPPDATHSSAVRGNVTLDDGPPQTAYLFPERDQRQASIVEIPVTNEDIRKNTLRGPIWLRHYQIAIQFHLEQGDTMAIIHPYDETLRRVLEACSP